MPPRGKGKSSKSKPVTDLHDPTITETATVPNLPVDATSEGGKERFIRTHTSNAAAHPGNVQIEADAAVAADEKRKLRIKQTPEEAKAMKARAAQEKAESVEKRNKAINKIVHIQMSREDSDAEEAAKTLEQLEYIDPADLPVIEGDSSDVAMRSNASSPPATDAEDNPVSRKKYKYFGLAVDSSGEDSGSEYQFGVAREEGISEDEVDIVNAPASTNMPAAAKTEKSGGKKLSARKERGLALRRDIEAAKAVQTTMELETDPRKRKISTHDSAEKEKKKLKNTNEVSGSISGAGLRSDWRAITMKDAGVAKLDTASAAMAPTPRPSANLRAVGFKATNVASGSGMVELDITERRTGPVSLVKAPRETAAMGVKIEFNKPKETVDETSNKTKSKPTRTSVTNADLKLSPEELKTWKKLFLPTLYTYIGSSGKPWEMGVDEAFLTDINMLWASIFPQHRLTIETSSFQYRLAAQRAYEWRSVIGNAAEKAVNLFWVHGDNEQLYASQESRVAYSKNNIGQGLRFLYGKPNMSGFLHPKKQKIFRTRPILYTFGHYLYTTERSKYSYDDHRGGLALSAAAVQRIFEIIAGVHKNGFTFVACGTPTAQCLEKVKDLSKAQWDDIITKARAIYREDNSKGAIDLEDGSEEDEWDDVVVQASSDGSDNK